MRIAKTIGHKCLDFEHFIEMYVLKLNRMEESYIFEKVFHSDVMVNHLKNTFLVNL